MNFFFLVLLLIASFHAEALQLEYVDIRDHIKFKSDHSEISKTVQKLIEDSPCLFASHKKADILDLDPQNCNSKIKYNITGAQGPLGIDDGKRFHLKESRKDSRENTILAVEFDGSDALSVKSNKTDIKLNLFIHDKTQYSSSNHLFFRKLLLSISEGNEPKVRLIKDITLTETGFSFFADSMARKTILADFKNQIFKIFPIASGSFDIRTLPGMDGFVGSMTEDLVNDARIYRGQPAGLHKTRTDKSMYHHRPFLGIVDNQGTEYKQIAWHYRMTENELVRGFITHGCMRTEDKDLYQMMYIVFYGSQKWIPVKVIQSFIFDSSLFQFIELEHPMPKENSYYNYINYYDKSYLSKSNRSSVLKRALSKPRNSNLSEVERYLWCIRNGEVQTDSQGVPFILRKHDKWRSALDSFCLTKIAKVSESPLNIIDYVLQKNNSAAPSISSSVARKPKVMNGLCDVSLKRASEIYSEKTLNTALPKDNRLTYSIYITNCGCKKFEQQINRSLLRSKGKILTIKDKKTIIQNYCGK